MGREALIEYASGKERAQVRAHLDSFALQLSGARKLNLPLADVRSAVASGDLLKIETKTAKFSLALGAKEAAAWAKKILNPPSLADKLGVKPGVNVAVIGERIAEIDDAVSGAAAVKHFASLAKAKTALAAADVVGLALSVAAEKDVATAAKMIGDGTALWLVYRKGAKPNGDDVIRLARAAGLKDTKVARVSETHAALRFIRAKG